jgi:hypothetical protein
MRKTRLLCIIAVAALVAFASVASAHVLTFRRAHNAAEAAARQHCNSFPTCTHYGAGSCRRITPHRIRCTAIVRDQAGGFCRWPVTARIKAGSNRLLVRSNPQQTQVCRSQ